MLNQPIYSSKAIIQNSSQLYGYTIELTFFLGPMDSITFQIVQSKSVIAFSLVEHITKLGRSMFETFNFVGL
jgi:hypothetical protein